MEERNYVQFLKVWSVFERILFCLFSWSKSKSKKSSQRPNQDFIHSRNSYQNLWLQHHLLYKKVLRRLQTNSSLMTPHLSPAEKSPSGNETDCLHQVLIVTPNCRTIKTIVFALSTKYRAFPGMRITNTLSFMSRGRVLKRATTSKKLLHIPGCHLCPRPL